MSLQRLYRTFNRFFRRRRMHWFEEYFSPSDSTQVLDVGGDQFNWQFLRCTPAITVLNLQKPKEWDASIKHIRFVFGNGTELEFKSKSFDIVYSNSVIEHLYTYENQERFAREILRVGRAVYVQTPARVFFVEPHLITPFVHWLPHKLEARVIRIFTIWGLVSRPTREQVKSFLEERRFLTYKEFAALFPDCTVIKERFLLMTKSYIAVKRT